MLTNFEAMILHVYPDQGGVPTVCVGHVVKAEDHKWIDDGITVDECRSALARDVAQFEDAITARVTVPISQPMIDALVSLTFNIGVGGFSTSSVLRYLNEGRYTEAADAFTLWRFVRVQQKDGTHVKKPILLGRREAEARLFRSGILEAAMGARYSEPPTWDELRAMVATTQVGLFDLVPTHSPIENDGEPLPEDNDHRSDDGRIVALPPEREEKEAA